MGKIENIINLSDFAPQRNPLLMITMPSSIDDVFIPAIRKRLEIEQSSREELYLDFGAFGNRDFWQEYIFEAILRLLLDMNILDRVTFVDLPRVFYDYIRSRCPDEICINTNIIVKSQDFDRFV